MSEKELHLRLLAIGKKVKAKGWPTASINIFVQYLAAFDRPESSLDPMISCRPSLQASVRDTYGSPTTHEFVRDGWDCKTIDDALEKLEAAADDMPTMVQKQAEVEMAKAKLTADERRLLGVR